VLVQSTTGDQTNDVSCTKLRVKGSYAYPQWAEHRVLVANFLRVPFIYVCRRVDDLPLSSSFIFSLGVTEGINSNPLKEVNGTKYRTTMRTEPQKFDVKSASYSKQEAQDAFLKDGAIVLTNVVPSESSSWQEISSSVPHLVWDSKDLLLQKHRADAVHVEHQKLDLAGEALHPHSDGYIWGDCFPDVVMLVCEEPAGNNEGSNYLIDGYDVIAQLNKTSKQYLENTLVDHTERSEAGYVDGAESIVQVIRWLDQMGWRKEDVTRDGDSGRLCWRRMINKDFAGKQVEDETGKVRYASLWTPVKEDSTEEKEAVNKVLYELDEAIAVEGRKSLRFALDKGEALLVDNFRMLHSREAFKGLDHKRKMWRIWSWTNASFGLPPQVSASSETQTDVPANILEAEQSIKA
jgi:alpha-ketoglutarate-dependent taurine dioxygenase